MPFRIEISEQGSISQIIRAVELALALDDADTASIRCDFDAGPWRHLLSGKQQVQLRRSTFTPRKSHIDGNFAPSDITSLWLRPAQQACAYPPDQAWLVSTGGDPTQLPRNTPGWFGHIQTLAPGCSPIAQPCAATMPIGLDTHIFARSGAAERGALVIGCGEPESDKQLIEWLVLLGAGPITLFDVYTQHVGATFGLEVHLVALTRPKLRAQMYRACRFVVSGSLNTRIDDHFVCEAVHTGAIALTDFNSEKPNTVWTRETFETAWRAAQLQDDAPPRFFAVMDVRIQAQTISGLIETPANQAPWTAEPITQFCSPDTHQSTGAQVAWIDCGRAALWDDKIAAWLAHNDYQVVYIDISRNVLLLSSIFTAYLTQQLRDRRKKMPHIQGIDDPESIRALVMTHLQKTPSHRVDVMHVHCSLAQVLQTRTRLGALSQDLKTSVDAGRGPGARKPMFFFNTGQPQDTTRLSARMIGAPVAAETIFSGLARESANRFHTAWLRRIDAWTGHSRIYYYPFGQRDIRDGDDLDVHDIRRGLISGSFDAMMTTGPLMTEYLYARRLWAQKAVPMVALLHSLHAIRCQLETLPQLLFAHSLASDLFISPTECGKIAYEQLLEHTADAIAQRTGIKPTYAGQTCVIAYGVDTSWFQNLHKPTCREMLRLPHERCIFLSFGRFDRREKFDLLPLLLALKQMVLAGDKPLLILAGADKTRDYSETLTRIAAELGLSEYVEVRTDLASAHKPYLYAACDVFVSPSDNIQETYGLTIVEAMAASLPIIASCWDGYRELIVHEQTGFLVRTRWAQVDPELVALLTLAENLAGYGHRDLHESVAIDVNELCATMRLLYSNRDLRRRMGEAGFRRSQEKFDIRGQSRVTADALIARAEMARHEPWPALTKHNRPYIDAVFTRFSHYTPDIISDDVCVQLTNLGGDAALLKLTLAAADFEDVSEDRKVHALVERLKSGPQSIASLQAVDIDLMRALRCLKYGIIKVAP